MAIHAEKFIPKYASLITAMEKEIDECLQEVLLKDIIFSPCIEINTPLPKLFVLSTEIQNRLFNIIVKRYKDAGWSSMTWGYDTGTKMFNIYLMLPFSPQE